LTVLPKIYAPDAYIDVTGKANPFPVPIVDLTPVSLTFISMTKDQAVGNTFAQSRNWDGRKLHEIKLPTSFTVGNETGGNLSYILPSAIRWWPTATYQAPMFKAKEMEDKWDVYRYDDELHFARSWTQALVYRAKIKITSDAPLDEDPEEVGSSPNKTPGRAIAGFEVVKIETNRGDDITATEAASEVDFLIKRLLLGLVVPAPLPLLDLRNPKQVESLWAMSFSMWGRAGIFGTFSPEYKKLFGNMTTIVS